jgi:hypothetical protein
LVAQESPLKFRIPEAADKDVVVLKDAQGNIIARTAEELDKAQQSAGNAAQTKQESK